MHCRFFNEYLLNAYEQATHQTSELPHAISLVQDSLQEMNHPVQLCGNILINSSTKFSVQGAGSYSIVSLSFPNGKCSASCSDGMCATHMKNEKNIPKEANKEERKPICSHIKNVCRNINYLAEAFLEYFDDTTLEIAEEGFELNFACPEEVNNEDGCTIPVPVIVLYLYAISIVPSFTSRV